MKPGPLNLDELDVPYVAVIQLRHQPQGVMHQVVLRPDKVKQTMRQCSLGHHHKSAIIVLGESGGDQAAGWQYPENVHVVSVLGTAHREGSESAVALWTCKPLE